MSYNALNIYDASTDKQVAIYEETITQFTMQTRYFKALKCGHSF